ncbi:hypothetical protein PILCRDRAFT_6205 [Piloderma croceum F 1598]|uniref:Uncharacterized protein n=1 Tax=Piloderma croceum (strain F 1598) TaxID=765440 RepID=A0A0C3FY10_PILCF|nr:hypothetical protein PILCRDRAFT_6205 [Piloderma croceum F 1598]
MPADASHHKRYSIPSHLSANSFDLQHGTSAKSSISNADFLSDCRRDHAGHRSMPPASKENNAFYSMTRRVLNEIFAALDFDKEAKARRRRRAELERRRFTRPSPSYGCTTIMVNQEAYDVPTLAHESGLRHFGERKLDNDVQPPPYTS